MLSWTTEHGKRHYKNDVAMFYLPDRVSSNHKYVLNVLEQVAGKPLLEPSNQAHERKRRHSLESLGFIILFHVSHMFLILEQNIRLTFSVPHSLPRQKIAYQFLERLRQS